jgi:hypothetical protein
MTRRQDSGKAKARPLSHRNLDIVLDDASPPRPKRHSKRPSREFSEPAQEKGANDAIAKAAVWTDEGPTDVDRQPPVSAASGTVAVAERFDRAGKEAGAAFKTTIREGKRRAGTSGRNDS